MDVRRQNHPYTHVRIRVDAGPRQGTWEVRPGWAVRKIEGQEAGEWEWAFGWSGLRSLLGQLATKRIYDLLANRLPVLWSSELPDAKSAS